MKRVVLIIFTCFSFFQAKADHITGGEMTYSYNGFSNNQHLYTITLKLFMRCNSGRQFPDPTIISIFDRSNFTRIRDISVPISSRQTLQLNGNENPCITDPPIVCYEVAYYFIQVSLPASAGGYILASEVNYRIRGISNIQSDQVGATFTTTIPGTIPNASYPENGGARFVGSDLVVVCADNYFAYSFAAEDPDADELRYSFCTAYGTTSGGNNAGTAPSSPPYNGLPYNGPDFGETYPLGNQVTIDAATGLITGVAPRAGIYVVTVCVEEIRDNVVIAVQRKDLQINITDCSIAAARLETDYMLCRNTRDLQVNNLSNSPLIVSYDWTVFNPAGTSIFTATTTTLNYTFPVNGVYRVQLIVNKGQQCTDTAESPVYVFPGMVTDFDVNGICITKPTVFTDNSTTPQGTINSWQWDFGETSIVSDISIFENPTYTYPSMGVKNVRLTVRVTNGCRDTVSKTITIIDKPPVGLSFRDTLICLNDQLPLIATGTGNFNWSPLVNISNPNSSNPVVSPPSTTKYYVDLNSDGCINRDSVLVRVVDRVSLRLMGDTTICTLDSIQLRVVSDGLKYQWTPSSQLLNDTMQQPTAITPATTRYAVTAVIGGCSSSGSILVTTVNYPVAFAGNDTTICYNSPAQLNAITDGSSWVWTPAGSLTNPDRLNPQAFPFNTTAYAFTAFDLNSGCPKPSRDTVIVTVLPKILAFAGNDTSVIIGQPLQLLATGGVRYEWSPGFSLSATDIPNPIATFNDASEIYRYKVRVYDTGNCVDSAFLNIKVFATLPTVFVPSAFTPNNDGLNDLLRPVAVGMQTIEYFNIYNRWGQLVFQTTQNGRGWDGKINGQVQASNTYVWMVKATDFMGKEYFTKGTVTLIR